MMKRGKGKNSRLLPTLRIISSCIKNVSTNASTAVRNAGASVAASVSSSADDHKDQVLWAGFDKLEFASGVSKRVLLVGYQNGFQVIDVEDGSNFIELVSKRTGPVTFLQMLPAPAECGSIDKLRVSRPILLVVGGDEEQRPILSPNQSYLARPVRDGTLESLFGNHANLPTFVQFYSLRSNSYEEVLSFQSAVFVVRCSPRIIAVGLEAQIYCYDALTLQKKFSVLTYPVPNFEGQRSVGVNNVCGSMALGPRWLAYSPNCPVLSSASRLSPKNVTSGLSPTTSMDNGSLVAHYAMESGKQLAAGIINLGDVGYKRLSKYCSDLLPDGHNSPGWRVGKLTAREMENAGMVIVKDVVSTEVISQFRAHTSPISALRFDGSGTLLVTASVHGNSLNVFRIMPSSISSGSGCLDWSCSHVHLYKLYRGMTKAVIQDICFSHCGRWITIISSKGTAHIFVLSPFGGNADLRPLPDGEGTTIYPVISLPWWSTSSFTLNQQNLSPPPPVTLSVVSRIRSNSSGLLSSVSNVAFSAIGKILVPSGAEAAIFHNCISRNPQDGHLRGRPLDHLLVYSPSGFVIQYELFPSMGEQSDSCSRSQSGTNVHTHEDELCVKADAVQWWDVCRRSDSLEREENICRTTFNLKNAPELTDHLRAPLPERSGENISAKSDSPKPLERPHWHLSNAEVQINADRLPIWQNSKIRLYVMSPLTMEYHVDREFEIEKVPFHEVDMKQKELLPVFNPFHSMRSGFTNRGFADGSPNLSSLGGCKTEDKINEAIVICHSEPASLGSTESSDAGSSNRIENLLDLDRITIEKSPTRSGYVCNDFYEENKGSNNLKACIREQKSENTEHIPCEYSSSPGFHNIRSTESKSVLKESTSISCTKTIEGGFSVKDIGESTDDSSLLAAKTDQDVSSVSIMKNPVDFKQFFEEGYCEVSKHHESCKSTEVVSNELNAHSSPSEREQPKNE